MEEENVSVNPNYEGESELVRLVEHVAEYGARRHFVGTRGDKQAIRRYAEEIRSAVESGGGTGAGDDGASGIASDIEELVENAEMLDERTASALYAIAGRIRRPGGHDEE